eukprot:m.132945 g.132945  ORF g.132945 m.132945 type:complete len:463 (+) comp14658_c0_seq2:243-1631(+)
MMASASQYERARQQTIEKNQEILNSLGLNALKLKTDKKKSAKRKAPERSIVPPRDRSKRLAGLDSDGNPLPPKPEIKTFAQEQATGRTRRDPFLGELDIIDHTWDEELNEDEDKASRKEAKRILKMPNSSKKAYKKEALLSHKIEEDNVAKVVPNRIYSMAMHTANNTVAVLAGDAGGVLGIWVKQGGTSSFSQFHFHVRPISSIILSQYDESKVLTSSYDGLIRGLDLTSEKSLELGKCDDEDIIFAVDKFDNSPSTFVASLGSGKAVFVDTRGRSKKQMSWTAHERARHVHVNQHNDNYLSTCGNSSVRIWDIRKLGSKKKMTPLSSLPHGKSVSSAFWSPLTGNKLVTTCKDDFIRVYQNLTDGKGEQPKFSIKHNNNTGRWLTTFKAIWEPRGEDKIIVGSMEKVRGIDILSASSGKRIQRLTNTDVQGSVSSLHACSTNFNQIAGGNASGKVFLWSR